ncbi:hypothetical protein [Hyphomicrobium sp.]|uniref:hypothetical protein n=1 Tax=Hyphomicrobium sp. TaxID=82 RepID=UPI001E151D80|nr:hypothetical protein [Hyphomicrobium sp.]MBY0559916.1 hypothetical protein [Hyphomicrobium sp.]
MDEFHKPGPACKHCKTVYVLHILAVRFRFWVCGKCRRLNVWPDDEPSVPALP